MRVFPPWGPWDRIFFSNDSDIFLSILILIITSLAIHYSQNVFRGFSILVCIGVQVCFRSCIFHSSSRAWLALALASRLPPFDRKTLKNCTCSADPGLLNETKGFLFLVFLHIKTDGKNKLLSLYVPIYRNVHFLVLLLKLHLTKLTKAWTQNTKNRWIEK